MLLRQSPRAADALAETYALTDGERSLLLNSPIGEGLLIASGERVGLRALASPEEARLLQTGLGRGGDARRR
jgi:hypothetical protein